MSDDLDKGAIEKLKSRLSGFTFGATPNTTLAGRHQAAAKAVPPADRRVLSVRTDLVDGQLNLKVPRSFANMVRDMARAEGIPIAQLIRKAVEQYKAGQS